MTSLNPRGRSVKARANFGSIRSSAQAAMQAMIEPLERRYLFSSTPLYWDPSATTTASGGSGT